MTGAPAGDASEGGAPWGDRRGGPGNFGGTKFQTDVAGFYLLRWIRGVLEDPSGRSVFRCEPRVPVGEGQLAADFGRETPGVFELVEVKSNPTFDEVLKLFADLAVALEVNRDGTRAVRLGLVAGRSNSAFAAAERLWRWGGEFSTDDDLRSVVGTHGQARDMELLNALGAEPSRALALLDPPMICPAPTLEKMIEMQTHYMCVPGRADDLRSRVSEVVSDMSTRRAGKLVQTIADELTDVGVLGPPVWVDTSTADPSLVSALTVLQVCPLPVPVENLAAAGLVTTQEVVAVLADHVEGGGVLADDSGRYYTPPSSAARFPSDPDGLGRALETLTAAAQSAASGYAHQAANALALARELVVSNPAAVTNVFVGFDKAVKAWGDLDLTYQLAVLATDAADRELSECVDDGERSVLVQRKVHTKICGQSWVLQRVGELDESDRELKEALGLLDRFPDADNHAFASKCRGRILRMRAEALSVDDPDRARLLDRSQSLLRDAFDEFELVVAATGKFGEDRGECQALLARTLATAGDLAGAADALAIAERLLEGRLESKAWADAVILRADMHLGLVVPGDSLDADQVAAVTRLIGSLDELVEVHDRDDVQTATHSSSEVAARAHVAAGRLYDHLSDAGSARVRYERAAVIYEYLRYADAAANARWRMEMLDVTSVPDGLRRAFDDAGDLGAPVKMLALQNWRAGRGPDSGDGVRADVDNPVWAGLVEGARNEWAAVDFRWRENRTA